MNADTARAEQALWEANTKVYANQQQQNVKRACIEALNLNTSVLKSYRRAQGGNIEAMMSRVHLFYERSWHKIYVWNTYVGHT